MNCVINERVKRLVIYAKKCSKHGNLQMLENCKFLTLLQIKLPDNQAVPLVATRVMSKYSIITFMYKQVKKQQGNPFVDVVITFK